MSAAGSRRRRKEARYDTGEDQAQGLPGQDCRRGCGQAVEARHLLPGHGVPHREDPHRPLGGRAHRGPLGALREQAQGAAVRQERLRNATAPLRDDRRQLRVGAQGVRRMGPGDTRRGPQPRAVPQTEPEGEAAQGDMRRTPRAVPERHAVPGELLAALPPAVGVLLLSVEEVRELLQVGQGRLRQGPPENDQRAANERLVGRRRGQDRPGHRPLPHHLVTGGVRVQLGHPGAHRNGAHETRNGGASSQTVARPGRRNRRNGRFGGESGHFADQDAPDIIRNRNRRKWGFYCV